MIGDGAWRVAGSHHSAFRADLGCWVFVEPTFGRTWQLSAGSAALVHAVEAGWPGVPVGDGAPAAPEALPPAVQAALRDAAVPPDTWGVVCADALTALADAGLLVAPSGADDPSGRPRLAAWLGALRAAWRDLRFPAGMLPPLVRITRPRVVLAAMLAVLALWVWVAFQLASPAGLAGFAPARAVLAQVTPVSRGLWWWLPLLVVGRLALHEFGHAVIGSAVIGEPVEVGLRFVWGIPQGYADVARIALVRDRAARLAVLLAGTAADVVVSLLLAGVLVATGALPLPLAYALKFILPAVVLGNLVPLFGSDGYLILADLTGQARLRVDAIAAVQAAVHGVLEEPPLPAWIAWYGMVVLLVRSGIIGTLVALAVAVGPGVGVAQRAMAPVLASLVTSAVLVWFLRRPPFLRSASAGGREAMA